MGSVPLVRERLPCSVVLPAGCGKTETIAALVAAVSADGQRSLVLTHTHAGVDALKRRFRKWGVAAAAATVRTLDSWCFDLISSFPQLADIEVDAEPDWHETVRYHAAGTQATMSAAVRRMLTASYELLIVDEYQDCQLWQHDLVREISSVVPTCVFGDPLQGLFFFGDCRPVVWERDVLPVFPAVELPITPWRWKGHNDELGEWLLYARRQLLRGAPIDLASGPVMLHHPQGLNDMCRGQPAHPQRVVAIAKWPRDCARIAAQLGGNYTMIEELEGKHLLAFADIVDGEDCAQIAAEVRNFATSCAYGVASIFDAAAGRTLAGGNRLDPGRYPTAVPQVRALNHLLLDCSALSVKSALKALMQLPTFRPYRREAWYGVLEALRLVAATPDLTVRQAVARTRQQLRVTGRRPESRILARPLLIKGLEFDHAVVTDSWTYDAHEFYVCLTRGSKSLTMVTTSTTISPLRPIAS